MRYLLQTNYCNFAIIPKHLKNIFQASELHQDTVCANLAHTASDGKIYNTQFYSMDAIISVGKLSNRM